MRIRKVETGNPRDVRAFIRFPTQLYRGNPYFCPQIESEIRLSMDRRRHPFYKHSAADFFVAESEGEVIGRIAAIHNTRHNEYRRVRTAFFWAFDVVEDFQVAERLFDTVFDWARQRERDSILGPRGLVGSDAAGVLVEGFDKRAVMGVPYNFPYYDDFLHRLGFEKLTDHLSGYLSAKTELPARILAVAEQVAERRGYRLIHFKSKEEMRSWAPAVFAVHEQAFSDSHEWHPNTEEEMHLVANSLIAIAEPRLIKLVAKGDQIIGFALIYPDLSDSLRRYAGRIHPVALLDLQAEHRRTKWLIANGVGVLPAYQNLGANAVLYAGLYRAVKQFPQFEHIEVVMVNEINFKSRADMESLGVKWVKRHRSYKRSLD
ncbi:MAG: GNAT family N-acetyltransferase [Anaerolineales bacterium]|nr:GNAT family N-acetyltransferase [Anaerolineales bacterium]MCX7608384.1 GNAT family N-acetyltransferase [Anaerolineales bacterium]